MADIGLQAIKRQDDPAMDLGNPLEAGGISQRLSGNLSVLLCLYQAASVR